MRADRASIQLGLLIVVTMTAATLSVGCGHSDQAIEPVPTFGTAVQPNMTALSNDASNPLAFPAYGDTEVPIVAGVGKRFAIVLEADPSTGYRWELAKPLDTAVVGSLGSQFLPAGTALPGAPDSELLSYVGNGVGATTIELRYSSASGQPRPADKTATFQVTVTIDGQPPPPPPEPETTTTTVFGATVR